MRTPLALLLLALVGGCALPAVTASTTAPTTTPAGPGQAAPTATAAVLAALAGLPSPGPVARPYDRSAFGQAWADTDRNGCDTRNDVLRRDLRQVVLKPGTRGCAVLRGVLDDPYTGRVLPFVRGGARVVEVDHVVALSNAWQGGASHWTYARLLAFANDPGELLAVSRTANRAKSDADASQWLPRAAARCDYAARQVAVKARYDLAVTSFERRALAAVLRSCPRTVLPPLTTPTLAPNRSPAPR